VLVAAALATTMAAGPARVAAALGLPSAAAGPGAGFLPEPTPVEVRSPSLTLSGLSGIAVDRPIPLAGGGESPATTTLLEFSSIQLDDLAITQSKAGPFSLAITNPGSGTSAAQIGGTGESVQLWGVVTKLDLCLSLDTLQKLVNGYSTLLGSVLGVVQGLLGKLAGAGPCVSLIRLLPLLGDLLAAGVPLPGTIPASDLDIDVYALHVVAGSGQTSLNLPAGQLVVSEP
jgi:hypothetical protein